MTFFFDTFLKRKNRESGQRHKKKGVPVLILHKNTRKTIKLLVKSGFIVGSNPILSATKPHILTGKIVSKYAVFSFLTKSDFLIFHHLTLSLTLNFKRLRVRFQAVTFRRGGSLFPARQTLSVRAKVCRA